MALQTPLQPIPDHVFNDTERCLLIDALNGLLEIKQKALQTVRAEGPLGPLLPGGREFTEHDFGIPQIQHLLARLSE